MLNAILSGKSGTVSKDLKEGTSWRTLYKGSEDLLTATVFERLSYLPAARFFEILSKTFRFTVDEIALDPEHVKLDAIEFWPRWEDTTEHAAIVEPDVYLRFLFGEVGETIDVIIEAKPYDTGAMQYKTQWIRQILAYKSVVDSPAEEKKSLKFLALGGLGRNSQNRFEKLKTEFYETVEIAQLPDNFEMMGCSWNKLLRVCQRLTDLSDSEFRIISDVLEGLSLSGYRKRYFFKNLKLSLSHEALDAALNKIGRV